MRKWFKRAVMKKAPFSLGGWGKSQSPKTRRRLALQSRPRNWSRKKRLLSVARALQALSNVHQDPRTKKLARRDAQHFLRLYRKLSR